MVFVEITTNIYRSLIFTAIRNLPSVCLKRLSKSFGSTVKIRQKTPIWALSQLGDNDNKTKVVYYFYFISLRQKKLARFKELIGTKLDLLFLTYMIPNRSSRVDCFTLYLSTSFCSEK